MALEETFPGLDRWVHIVPDETRASEISQQASELRRATSSNIDLFEAAKRVAAIDTGAIEDAYSIPRGATVSLATAGAGFDRELERLPDAKLAIQDQLNGYDLVLDWATRREERITEAGIRHLHEVLLQSTDTYRVQVPGRGYENRGLSKGSYKTEPNNPTLRDGERFIYSPVDDVPIHMHKLVNDLNSPEFEILPLWTKVAFAHYAFVRIHPFADGNGRVARALASYPLFRELSIPLIVMKDMRDEYFDALEGADSGDLDGFANFLAEATQESLAALSDEVARAEIPQLTESMQRLRDLRASNPGLPAETIARSGDNLVDFIHARASALWADFVAEGGTSSVQTVSMAVGPVGDWQPKPGRNSVLIQASSPPPLAGAMQLLYQVRVRPAAWTGPLFCIQTPEGGEVFEVGISEVVPTLSRPLMRRLARWLSTERDANVAELARQAESEIRSRETD